MSSDDDEAISRIPELIFRARVEDGEIQIEDRSTDQILTDFREYVKESLNEFSEEGSGGAVETWQPVIDHRSYLRERVEQEVVNGDPLVAITMHVIWLEHFVNGILVLVYRRHGHNPTSFMPVIRRLNIETKITAIWQLLDLPMIDAEAISHIKRAIEIRNGFVHYKWTALSWEELDAAKLREQKVADAICDVVSNLEKLEKEILWMGREAEIIAAFRDDVRHPR